MASGPISSVQFSSVQSLSHVRLFATPIIAARQASLSITNSRSSLRLTSIDSVMPSSHLILCRPLLLLPPIPPIIRVFSQESSPMPEFKSTSRQIDGETVETVSDFILGGSKITADGDGSHEIKRRFLEEKL